jgi:SAM-dependent methyltransferase
MDYIHSLSTSPSFIGKGLVGYAFAPLLQSNLAIDYVEVETGHDTFMISKKITRSYYIISGNGYFTIDNREYPVNPGMLVEVPPRVEYSYSGKMTLLLFQRGRWLPRNDTYTKWNPDVVQGDFPCSVGDGFWLTQLARFTIFGKSPVNAYLRLNRRIWNNLPASFTTFPPIRLYGDFLHTLARMQGVRGQACATHFLRNRPQLELLRRLTERNPNADQLRVAVLGCSTGAEAYSVAWTIRSGRPDLRLILCAVDISKQAVEVGKSGVYSLIDRQLTNTNIFERMTDSEIDDFFDKEGEKMTVKSWIAEGIKWQIGDVAEPQMTKALGPQDIVIANNFLCHMEPPMAERCLRNIARMVSSGGYLFVSGIDLDIRTKVAKDLEWHPLQESLEEIHAGDPCMSVCWPFHYGGLEPLNKRRKDWQLRYASAFQLISSCMGAQNRGQFVRVADSGPRKTANRDVSAAVHLANGSTRVCDGR